jgi:hypothetical protein
MRRSAGACRRRGESGPHAAARFPQTGSVGGCFGRCGTQGRFAGLGANRSQGVRDGFGFAAAFGLAVGQAAGIQFADLFGGIGDTGFELPDAFRTGQVADVIADLDGTGVVGEGRGGRGGQKGGGDCRRGVLFAYLRLRGVTDRTSRVQARHAEALCRLTWRRHRNLS